MINDNTQDTERTQRTFRPQERTREKELVRENESQQPVMQQQQQQQMAGGKKCPFCGAVNEPEAMFCAQCGQPISKSSCPFCGSEIDPRMSVRIAVPTFRATKPTVLNAVAQEAGWYVLPVIR